MPANPITAASSKLARPPRMIELDLVVLRKVRTKQEAHKTTIIIASVRVKLSPRLRLIPRAKRLGFKVSQPRNKDAQPKMHPNRAMLSRWFNLFTSFIIRGEGESYEL